MVMVDERRRKRRMERCLMRRWDDCVGSFNDNDKNQYLLDDIMHSLGNQSESSNKSLVVGTFLYLATIP